VKGKGRGAKLGEGENERRYPGVLSYMPRVSNGKEKTNHSLLKRRPKGGRSSAADRKKRPTPTRGMGKRSHEARQGRKVVKKDGASFGNCPHGENGGGNAHTRKQTSRENVKGDR